MSGMTGSEVTVPLPLRVPVVPAFPRFTHWEPFQPAIRTCERLLALADRLLAASKCRVMEVLLAPSTFQYSTCETALRPLPKDVVW